MVAPPRIWLRRRRMDCLPLSHARIRTVRACLPATNVSADIVVFVASVALAVPQGGLLREA